MTPAVRTSRVQERTARSIRCWSQGAPAQAPGLSDSMVQRMNGSATGPPCTWCAPATISGMERSIATAPTAPLTIALSRSSRNSRPAPDRAPPAPRRRSARGAAAPRHSRRRGSSPRAPRRGGARVVGDRRVRHHQIDAGVQHPRGALERLPHPRLAGGAGHPADRDLDLPASPEPSTPPRAHGLWLPWNSPPTGSSLRRPAGRAACSCRR